MDKVTLTDVYDNVRFDSALPDVKWGFAAVLENVAGLTLFDTGGDGAGLMGNLAALDFDPRKVRRVFLSHAHYDHTGGLQTFLEANGGVEVFGCASFPDEIENLVSSMGGRFVRVSDTREIAAGLISTGEMPGVADEQSLLIELGGAFALVTGCAHPGIVNIAKRAVEIAGGPVRAVFGGFHLEETDEGSIREICDALEGLGVEKLGASHCTGEPARAFMRERWGANWVEIGCGARVALP